jgi:hypothetical protein
LGGKPYVSSVTVMAVASDSHRNFLITSGSFTPTADTLMDIPPAFIILFAHILSHGAKKVNTISKDIKKKPPSIDKEGNLQYNNHRAFYIHI